MHVVPDRILAPGKCWVFDRACIQPTATPRKWLYMAQSDWDRLDAARREELADDLVRENAEAGQRRLEQWLAGEGEGTPDV